MNNNKCTIKLISVILAKDCHPCKRLSSLQKTVIPAEAGIQFTDKVSIYEGCSSVSDIKLYLSKLKGRKIFTVEETSTSQWLYSELRSYVTRLIVCDPHRNRLLSEGAKNDRIYASKLVFLLRSNMLKEVYHSGEEFIYLRKLVSGYEDVGKK